MAGRFWAVARDGPAQNGTGLSSAGHLGRARALKQQLGHRWFALAATGPSASILPLQSIPCPLQDAQVPPGQVTAPASPRDPSAPAGDRNNPKEQQVVGRNHSTPSDTSPELGDGLGQQSPRGAQQDTALPI